MMSLDLTSYCLCRSFEPKRDESTRRDLSRRFITGVLLLSVLLTTSGCSVYQLGRRTLFGELAEYPQVTDGRLACKQYERWAKREWKRIKNENPDSFSSDYASGFVQGFTDQVYAGGPVRTPTVPPRRYWRVGYRNARGAEAIQDWYAGFTHGSQVAKDGGYRQKATVPLSRLIDIDEAQSAKSRQESWNENWHESSESAELGGVATPTPNEHSEIESVPDIIETPPDPAPAGVFPEEPTPDSIQLDEDLPMESNLGQPSSSVRPAQFDLTDAPSEGIESEPVGPPLPPWKRPVHGGGAIAKPKAGEIDFDPFSGTRFETTLGQLTPSDSESGSLEKDESGTESSWEVPSADESSWTGR